MNGLPGRAARLGAWRNSPRKARRESDNGTEMNPEAHAAPGCAPAALGRTVEREVIPRLMVAHGPRGAAARGASALPQDARAAAELIEFTDLLATHRVADAMARIEAKRAQGLALEALYLQFLIPAARRLASLWEADLCHYEDIATGMLHLQQVLQALSPGFAVEGQCRSRGRKAMLLSAPGEQNMLGVFMVTEFYRCVTSDYFHRAGWDVWRAPPTSRAQLLDILSSQWFDVIDVCASCEPRLPLLSVDLAEMRRVSRNSHVGVMVGGPAFDDHPEFAGRVGADASVPDLRDTVAQAEMLVALRAREG
jgi:MerR family transcriptional regulator, light-induced transcriptional regulator